MLRYFDGRPHSELRTIVFVAMLLSQVGAEPFDRVPNFRYTGKLSFSSNEIVMKRAVLDPFRCFVMLIRPTAFYSFHVVTFGCWFWGAVLDFEVFLLLDPWDFFGPMIHVFLNTLYWRILFLLTFFGFGL